ncbi:MAG TPA: cytochrome c [Bryobacteraceae bacterium]|nr:cytochrome c [Bryobacteraceae bacterium]
MTGARLCSLVAGGLMVAIMPSMAATLAQNQVTFTKDVAPIFQEKCQDCHRKGSMAPMSLVTYEETRPWAKAIRERVMKRQMPPWHIDKTVGIQHFQNDISLSDQQIATIVHWVDSGAPMGDAKDMPPAKVFPNYDGWQLAKEFGQPDLVIKSDDYTMPAHGQDVWFKPLTAIPITEPRWVRAVEIRPGTPAGRKIMHHVLARLQQDEPGAEEQDVANVGPGLLMEWAIGKNYDVYRNGAGKLLLPGAHIWWELHLHAVGEQIRDHAELGVYLYPKGLEPKNRTRLMIFNATPNADGGAVLDIAPNSIAETQGFYTLRQNARLENFQPHMHLRGKAMEMEAVLPDGRRQVLSYVDHFNFNWMINYIYADDAAPVLPKGTVLHITAWHDNTSNNPNNPDPNQWVGWGDRTVDEMAHAWVNVTYLSDDEYKQWLDQHKPKQPAQAVASR